MRHQQVFFDRGRISPVNEIYTPGSQVQFTYVPVDSSNTPVEEIPALTLAAQRGKCWRIDPNTGLFNADETQTGEVTAQLVEGWRSDRGERHDPGAELDEITLKLDP